MQISDSIGNIKGIGKARQEEYNKNGILQVGDLIGYLPYTYEDSSHILDLQSANNELQVTPIWDLPNKKIAVSAILEKLTNFRTRSGLYITTGSFSDSSIDKKIKAIWFNQSYVQQQLTVGCKYVLFGKVKKEGQSFSFQSPKFEEIHAGSELKKLGGVLPVYRRIKSITSTYSRKYIQEALAALEIEEFLPTALTSELALPPLIEALSLVHLPNTPHDPDRGYKRLAIQELLELRDDFEKSAVKSNKNNSGKELTERFAKLFGNWIPKLPFELTRSQSQVLELMLSSIRSGEYLDTFVYGDVGSGKTIIALLFAFAFAAEGFSSVIIAPTTILVSQHLKTANALVKQFGITSQIKVDIVASGASSRLSLGAATVYIGTQAILHREKLLKSESVRFVCIDEQHRFGVEQRNLLKKQARHLITLSATPIPRTLALSFLGFSNAAYLEEKPQGRKEVVSRLVPKEKEEEVYEWIVKHLEKEEQVYIVFPRIESEEDSEKQSLLAMSQVLKEAYFQKYSSSLLYGSMKAEDKDRVMADFSSGKIRLLFSTSVIEVGVDVASATIIAIHGAELFGLAQLHQLRGRVGRSSQQGYCLLFTEKDTDEVGKRLDYFTKHSEGLAVAEYDLKSRGTGTLLGKQQSGLSELRIAQVSDLVMIKESMDIYELLRRGKVAIRRYFRLKSTNE